MLAPSDGGLILYQAYGNIYAMTGRKAYLLEDKQIPSVGVFDEVFLALGWHLEEIHVTWAHLEKKQTRLRTYTKSLKKYCLDGVASIKRRRHNLFSDGVWNLETILLLFLLVEVLRRPHQDTEDILDDAAKSQIKMKNKMKDPIAIEKIQNLCTIDYKKLNALYEDFVPQKELSAEQKYFPSSFISFENSSNASSSYSSSETKPTVTPMPSKKAYLLEDKQIPIVGVFDEVFSTWMAFGRNTRDLGSFGEETGELTDLHQILEEVLLTKRRDGVAGIKGRCRDPSSDGVRDLVRASRRLRATSSVRRPSNRDSSFKNSVLSNTKNSSEKVKVFYRSNNKPDVASKNVALDKKIVKKIVTNDDIKNTLIAKNVLCVSCAKNVLIPCHDNCLAKYKLNVHSKVRRALFTTSRTVKSKFEDTTPVVLKTRFSVKTVQSKFILDTTP
ncbi:hypothetical protein Tco_0676151 [Tanacetum coccineum]